MNLFATFKPQHPQIANYVQYYYQDINTDNINREFTCFPHYNNSLSIYNSHIRQSDGTVLFLENAAPLQMFTPIRKEVLTVRQKGSYHRIVIVFQPLGIRHFFNNHDLSTFRADVAFFTPSELKLLFECFSSEELPGLLDSFLYKRFVEKESTVLDQAVAYIMEHYQNFSVEVMSGTLNISRRHLNRLFNKELGLPVKKFQEIVLFRNTLYQRMKEPDQNLTSITYKMSYSDQSHLIKLFTKMTSNSPVKFFKKGRLLGQEDTFWHFNE